MLQPCAGLDSRPAHMIDHSFCQADVRIMITEQDSRPLNGKKDESRDPSLPQEYSVQQRTDYGNLGSLGRPLMCDREITTNSPHRWHFTTRPLFSSRAVSRPQRQRTSLADEGTSVVSLISISHVDKGHSPFPTRTYERDRTSPIQWHT